MREMDAFEQAYKNGFAAGMKAAEEKIARHARWEIILRQGCFDWCCCSNCGEIDKRQRGIQTPYCWHCGAKMAEEKMDCVSDFWR